MRNLISNRNELLKLGVNDILSRPHPGEAFLPQRTDYDLLQFRQVALRKDCGFHRVRDPVLCLLSQTLLGLFQCCSWQHASPGLPPHSPQLPPDEKPQIPLNPIQRSIALHVSLSPKRIRHLQPDNYLIAKSRMNSYRFPNCFSASASIFDSDAFAGSIVFATSLIPLLITLCRRKRLSTMPVG